MATAIKITPVDMLKRQALGIRAGDTVRVHQKVKEGEKTRLQVFEGLVLTVKHGNEAGGTFTVRREVGGIGVERIFPLYTPMVEKIEITKRAKVRQSKLYHIRDKAAKEIRRKMKNELRVSIKEEDMQGEEIPEEEVKEENVPEVEKVENTEETKKEDSAEEVKEEKKEEKAEDDKK